MLSLKLKWFNPFELNHCIFSTNKLYTPNVQPSLYCLLTNWLASSKLVIFIFFASHSNFLRPSHLSFHPLPVGFRSKKLRIARLPIKILSVNGPAYSNGELVFALP